MSIITTVVPAVVPLGTAAGSVAGPDVTSALGAVGIAIDVFALLAAVILIAARHRPRRRRHRSAHVWRPAHVARGIVALVVALLGAGVAAVPAHAQGVDLPATRPTICDDGYRLP